MSYVCPACGHTLTDQVRTFEVRQKIAVHRQAHERQEKRRAQWRESKRRFYARQRNPAAVGYLHNLGCGGGHVKGRGKCVPIPCYAGRP